MTLPPLEPRPQEDDSRLATRPVDPIHYGLMREPSNMTDEPVIPTRRGAQLTYAVPDLTLGITETEGSALSAIRTDATIYYPPSRYGRISASGVPIVVNNGVAASAVLAFDTASGLQVGGWSYNAANKRISTPGHSATGGLLLIKWTATISFSAPSTPTTGHLEQNFLVRHTNVPTSAYSPPMHYDPALHEIGGSNYYRAALEKPTGTTMFEVSGTGTFEFSYSVNNQLDSDWNLTAFDVVLQWIRETASSESAW